MQQRFVFIFHFFAWERPQLNVSFAFPVCLFSVCWYSLTFCQADPCLGDDSGFSALNGRGMDSKYESFNEASTDDACSTSEDVIRGGDAASGALFSRSNFNRHGLRVRKSDEKAGRQQSASNFAEQLKQSDSGSASLNTSDAPMCQNGESTPVSPLAGGSGPTCNIDALAIGPSSLAEDLTLKTSSLASQDGKSSFFNWRLPNRLRGGNGQSKPADKGLQTPFARHKRESIMAHRMQKREKDFTYPEQFR